MVKNHVIKKNSLAPTVLISGGAGFIGSHLVEQLLSGGAKVLVLDNFNTGKEVHVNHLLSNPNFALFNVDINQGLPQEIESVDYVFQLAGHEDYMYSKDSSSLDSLLTNSLGTKNLLDLVKRSDAKFVLVSTTDVYQGKMAQDELSKYFGTTSLEENKFSSIEAKRFAEAIVWEYYKKYDLDVRIARVPEVYGPRMSLDSSSVLGLYIKSMIESRDIEILNDGVEKEFYLYVTDAVSGILRSLYNSATKGNIYSLVPEEQISQLEVAYLLRSVADGAIQLTFKPTGFSLPLSRPVPDTYNLKDLSWHPKIGMKEGIIQTLKWFGYSVNKNDFKPRKYVEEKMESKKAAVVEKALLPETQKITTISSVYPSDMSKVFDGSIGVNEKILSGRKRLLSRLFGKKHSSISGEAVSGLDTNKRVLSKKSLYIGAILFSAVLVFLINPLLGIYLNIRRGVSSLEKVADAGKVFDTRTMSSESLIASASLDTASKKLSEVKWLWSLTKSKSTYLSYYMTLKSLKNFSDSIYHLSASAEPLNNVWDVLRPDTNDFLTVETVSRAKLEIDLAQKSLYMAEADFGSVDKNKLPSAVSPKMTDYEKYIDSLQSSLSIASGIIGDVAGVLGLEKPTTYVLWFQNSNELRPTGGFIGSYGLLSFDKGKLKDLKIDDIYNPDGQIMLREINVAPPAVMETYLNEERLYLRNSNWDPDFESSAQRFDDLYYRLTGSKVDGYIAVDLKFVEGVLRATGPVFLAAYNEEITADNLYERAQYHSDFNYKDGSDQKRSFLTVLTTKLLEKVFSLPKEQFASLASEIFKSLNEKHFLVYLTDNPLNSLLEQQNWNGGIVKTDGDYLYVVDSNLGGTKANYFVKESIDYEVSSLTRDGLLRAVLKINYNHTGEDIAWPGGPYKDYVRVLVQKGSKLTGAEFIKADGTSEDIFAKVDVREYIGREVFSYGIEVNPKEAVSLVLKYDLPESSIISKENSNYSLYVQKQPGTDAIPFNFIFNPPFGTEVISKSANAKVVESKVISNNFLLQDNDYFIELR